MHFRIFADAMNEWLNDSTTSSFLYFHYITSYSVCTKIFTICRCHRPHHHRVDSSFPWRRKRKRKTKNIASTNLFRDFVTSEKTRSTKTAIENKVYQNTTWMRSPKSFDKTSERNCSARWILIRRWYPIHAILSLSTITATATTTVKQWAHRSNPRLASAELTAAVSPL